MNIVFGGIVYSRTFFLSGLFHIGTFSYGDSSDWSKVAESAQIDFTRQYGLISYCNNERIFIYMYLHLIRAFVRHCNFR